MSPSLSLQQMERILNKASKTHKHRVEVNHLSDLAEPHSQTCKAAQLYKSINLGDQHTALHIKIRLYLNMFQDAHKMLLYILPDECWQK